jgi:serine/threonine protein phosphatase PrpC
MIAASLRTPIEPRPPQQGVHANGERRLEVAVASACGTLHPCNEDAHSALAPPCADAALFVVADGVGGGAQAALASRELVAQLHARLGRGELDAARVRRAMLDADRAVAARISRESSAPGAATVALCAPMNPRASAWLVAWVGDCRVYRHRIGASIELLTRDDTFRQLGERAPPGGSPDDPARMVGNGATDGANVALHMLRPHELLALCSDGVHKHLDPADWARVLDRSGLALAERCAALVTAARANGSTDDATVLLLRRGVPAEPCGQGPTPPPDPHRNSR